MCLIFQSEGDSFVKIAINWLKEVCRFAALNYDIIQTPLLWTFTVDFDAHALGPSWFTNHDDSPTLSEPGLMAERRWRSGPHSNYTMISQQARDVQPILSGQRRRRCASIETIWAQCLVFAGISYPSWNFYIWLHMWYSIINKYDTWCDNTQWIMIDPYSVKRCNVTGNPFRWLLGENHVM